MNFWTKKICLKVSISYLIFTCDLWGGTIGINVQSLMLFWLTSEFHSVYLFTIGVVCCFRWTTCWGQCFMVAIVLVLHLVSRSNLGQPPHQIVQINNLQIETSDKCVSSTLFWWKTSLSFSDFGFVSSHLGTWFACS